MDIKNSKLATIYEDNNLYILDIEKNIQEKILSGHGNEIQCVSYHDSQCLIATGSKDQTIRIWDPRIGDEIMSINKHNNTVNKIKWNFNGNWLLSCSKDQSVKLFDIRNNQNEINSWKDSQEVTAISWHPFYQTLFCSANAEANLNYRLTFQNQTLFKFESRNIKTQVFDILFSPNGDSLVTLNNDKKLDFFIRNELKRFNFQVKTNLINDQTEIIQVQQQTSNFQQQIYQKIPTFINN